MRTLEDGRVEAAFEGPEEDVEAVDVTYEEPEGEG